MAFFKTSAKHSFRIGLILSATIGCKTGLQNKSGELVALDDLKNYEKMPELSCINADVPLESALGSEDESFSISEEIGSPDREETAEISDEALGMYLTSTRISACPYEISSILNSSTTDLAQEKGSENTFALTNAQSILRLPKRIHSAIVKVKGSRALKVFFANGKSQVWKVKLSGKTGLLSSKDRIKFFPESNRIVSYKGPRFVKPEVLESSRYNILIRSLEKNRSEYFVKFKNWLQNDLKNVHTIKATDYSIPSSDPEVARGMKAIFNLMSDPELIFRHLQGLEMDVAKRMASKGETMETALEALLTATEKKHKFLPAYDLTTLSRESFKTPALFRDRLFRAGSSHGIQIHRIQWNVLMRHMDETPSLKDKVPASKLYVLFGEGVPRLAEGESGAWGGGWYDLFDGGNAWGRSSFGRPENWRSNFTNFLPTLAGWP